MLGAFVLVFRKPVDHGALEGVKSRLKAVSTVVKKGCGYGWDGICLAVGMAQSETPHLQLGFEEWEDICRELQFEYVDSEAKGRNEFGGMFVFATSDYTILCSPKKTDAGYRARGIGTVEGGSRSQRLGGR